MHAQLMVHTLSMHGNYQKTLQTTNQSRLPKRDKHHDCSATTNQSSHACSTDQLASCAAMVMTSQSEQPVIACNLNKTSWPMCSKDHAVAKMTNQSSHACSTNQVGPCAANIMPSQNNQPTTPCMLTEPCWLMQNNHDDIAKQPSQSSHASSLKHESKPESMLDHGQNCNGHLAPAATRHL